MARALRGKTNVGLGWVLISTQKLKVGRVEDIKDIWDVMGGELPLDGGFGINTKDEMLFEMLFVDKSKYDWEEAWGRLQQISEMTEREFNAWCGKEVGWTRI